jgi:hypothetical protein
MTTVIRETLMRHLHPWLRQWASLLAVMLGLLGLLVLVVVALLYVLGFRAYHVVSDLTLWATGLIILAYTLETWALHQQLVRQYELDVRPLLIVTGPDATGASLQVRNIGRSPALAIRLDPLVIPLGTEAHPRLTFGTLSYLEPHTAATIPHTEAVAQAGASAVPGQALEGPPPDLVRQLFRAGVQETRELHLHYHDVTGRPYETVMRLGKDGPALISST